MLQIRDLEDLLQNCSTGFHLSDTAHHLSEILSSEVGGSFYEVIARYRVAEACRMLSEPSDSAKTVLEIAFAAGFNSKASFHRAFRRETGTTPTSFRRSREVNVSLS